MEGVYEGGGRRKMLNGSPEAAVASINQLVVFEEIQTRSLTNETHFNRLIKMWMLYMKLMDMMRVFCWWSGGGG